MRAEAKGLEQDRGSPTQDGVAADHLLDAVTLCPAACRALRHFDTCSQALPAERSLDRVREAAAGLARFQQRARQGGVVARHDRERLGLGEKVLLMPPVGCAPGGADQFVEHLHGQVSQRRLALDGKRHQRREPVLRSKAQQLARRQDARLTGQDGVAVGVNRAPPLVAEADPAQHSQPRRDPGEVLQRWSFPGLADPAVLGAAIVSPLSQQCFQGGALCASRPRARSRWDCRRAIARPASARRSTRAGGGMVTRRSLRSATTARAIGSPRSVPAAQVAAARIDAR